MVEKGRRNAATGLPALRQNRCPMSDQHAPHTHAPHTHAPDAPQRQTSHPSHRHGLAFGAGAAVLFGTSYVATAFALRSFSPFGVAVWRGLGATLLMLVLVTLHHGTGLARLRAMSRGDVGRLLALGMLGGPGLVAGMNLAVAATGATIASFVAGLYAVLAAVIAPVVLGERLPRSAAVGFVTALAGTALLADLQLGSSAGLGVLAGLGAAVSYAFYLVLSRRWGTTHRVSGEAVSVAIFALTAIVLLPIDLLVDRRGLAHPGIDPVAVAGLVWLVVFPSAVANLMIQASVRRIPARRSSALLLLNPIAATILSALLLGERLGPVQAFGAVLVLAGMAISNGLIGVPLSLRPAGARA